ncbi:DUF2460 domain-containing protein [Sphingomonas sp. CV7422]|uniref:DUF2460 domain-containing protein n=1 Tax=Sphingomonas sp. CV7422 TaxID=3018036 RepID=UPI0022FF13B3|nr:DUF2460 domain-containing protein [Sphingomonas sp. CV7422]
MAFWLCATPPAADAVLSRFDARFWTVDFPRPMMAAVTNPAADALRVDLVFQTRGDLAGLIWAAEDRFDHPLLRYATERDFRGCRFRFRWRSQGILPLDAVNGPTLTIEGRDAAGQAATWYVRLWNYATGTPEDAAVTLDFADLAGGFRLPDDARPVWAGDIDRLFVSMVPPGYDGSDALLPAAAEGWVELSDIACDGPGAVIGLGDVVVPEHGFAVASGYDDSYHLTPARLLRNALHLGYRGAITHYVGMSHYFRLEPLGAGLYVSLRGGVINAACAAWHRDFAERAQRLGYALIWSLSYELLDAHCWNDWKQRAADGTPARTGWTPPSALLSPAHDGAMRYLHQVATAFVGLGVAAGLAPHFQVGEPWWWLMADGRPCLYDAAAVAAFAPVAIRSVRAPLDAVQRATLDRAGAALAASTSALVAQVRGAFPGCRTYLLAYLPTVLDGAAPDWARAALPVGWAAPAFDVLQLEDYDWVTAGDGALTARGVAVAQARLGYPPAEQQYFAGFVAEAAQAAAHWPRIEAAAQAARARGAAAVTLWALPQVMRDGFVHFEGEDAMQDYDDILFPIALGREAAVTPAFSTTILTAAGGAEQRNAAWAEARTSYDVGPGVRSEADIAVLLAFFRARMGPARAFRLRDPFDAEGQDEPLGSGDGVRRQFALVRHYGAAVRRIVRPVEGSVRVAIDGVATQAFSLVADGMLLFDTAPAAGTRVTASFVFDVVVRFAEDHLRVSRTTFLAGEAVSVPLIEVRT